MVGAGKTFSRNTRIVLTVLVPSLWNMYNRLAVVTRLPDSNFGHRRDELLSQMRTLVLGQEGTGTLGPGPRSFFYFF